MSAVVNPLLPALLLSQLIWLTGCTTQSQSAAEPSAADGATGTADDRSPTAKSWNVATRRSTSKADLLRDAMDPSADGWGSEVLGARVTNALTKMADAVSDRSRPSNRAVGGPSG